MEKKTSIQIEYMENTQFVEMDLPFLGSDSEQNDNPSQQPTIPALDQPVFEHVSSQLNALVYQMGRLEKGLSAILKHLQLPDLDTLNGYKQGDDMVAMPMTLTAQETKAFSKEGPYKYQTLDASKSEIRLLVIHDAEDQNEQISGEIIKASLDEDPTHFYLHPFTALSYTWGEPNFDHFISIDGHQFPVTKNLATALRYMRKYRNSQPNTYPGFNAGIQTQQCWWIDQICINQSDIEERNYQVTLMRRIYKNASVVNVWLGEAADDSDLAMELFNQIGKPPVRAPGEKKVVYPVMSLEETSRHWKALDMLFRRPWWDRAWVRQEAALSHNVTVYCGKSNCSIELIGASINAFHYLQSLGYEAALMPLPKKSQRLILPSYFQAQLITEIRKKASNGYTFVDFIEVLFHSRSCKATDWRDKVFSILGLVDPEKYDLDVDYRRPFQEIFVETARVLFKDQSGLDLLGAAQNPERRHGLPSWVPNLIDEWKAHPFTRKDDRGFLRSKDVPDLRLEGDILLVKGYNMDTIAAICNDIVEETATTEQLDNVYLSWRTFVRDGWGKRQSGKHKINESEYDRFISNPEPGTHGPWIRFLSLGENNGHDMEYSYEGEALPETEEVLQTEYLYNNLKLIRSYLLPSDFKLHIHPLRKIHDYLRKNGVGRRLCVTAQGYIGLFPADSKIGDSIALFQGAAFPYILRKQGDKDFVLVGESFVLEYEETDVFDTVSKRRKNVSHIRII